MATHLRTLLVAVALTLAIALISGGRWPHYLMGAGFTLSLFVMLLFSTYGQAGAGRESLTWPTWTSFALAAVITVVLGSVLLMIGDSDNGAWWGPAAIMAAAITWPVANRSRLEGSDPEAG